MLGQRCCGGSLLSVGSSSSLRRSAGSARSSLTTRLSTWCVPCHGYAFFTANSASRRARCAAWYEPHHHLVAQSRARNCRAGLARAVRCVGGRPQWLERRGAADRTRPLEVARLPPPRGRERHRTFARREALRSVAGAAKRAGVAAVVARIGSERPCSGPSRYGGRARGGLGVARLRGPGW